MGHFKKFDGVTYRLYACEQTKAEAEKFAKQLRAKGKNVKVQRYSGWDLPKIKGKRVGYHIYIKKGEKIG